MICCFDGRLWMTMQGTILSRYGRGAGNLWPLEIVDTDCSQKVVCSIKVCWTTANTFPVSFWEMRRKGFPCVCATEFVCVCLVVCVVYPTFQPHYSPYHLIVMIIININLMIIFYYNFIWFYLGVSSTVVFEWIWWWWLYIGPLVTYDYLDRISV